ncbi:MAG: hypothetical protein Q4A26_01905 [Candidatus Saccharibacteria bacterium]|nr:hypothetical protein [Candidatus Saccharibacteria bacterium]
MCNGKLFKVHVRNMGDLAKACEQHRNYRLGCADAKPLPSEYKRFRLKVSDAGKKSDLEEEAINLDLLQDFGSMFNLNKRAYHNVSPKVTRNSYGLNQGHEGDFRVKILPEDGFAYIGRDLFLRTFGYEPSPLQSINSLTEINKS